MDCILYSGYVVLGIRLQRFPGSNPAYIVGSNRTERRQLSLSKEKKNIFFIQGSDSGVNIIHVIKSCKT